MRLSTEETALVITALRVAARQALEARNASKRLGHTHFAERFEKEAEDMLRLERKLQSE